MVAVMQQEHRSRARREELLAAALTYAERGWYVFPLHAPGISTPCDCGKEDCANPGKHPQWARKLGLEHGWQDASHDPERIRAWWRQWPYANIGLATGPSGLVVLDVDPRHDGERSLAELVKRHGMVGGVRQATPVMEQLAATLVAETGGGGQHYLFRTPPDEQLPDHNEGLAGLSGLDVKARGGYIVAPPSWHVNGPLYQWQDGEAWREIAIAPLPEWLAAVIRKPERRTTTPAVAPHGQGQPRQLREGERPGAYWVERALEGLREGGRNSRGFWLACQLRDDGIEQDTAEGLMVEFADKAPGGASLYSSEEALQSLRSAYRSAPRERARSTQARATAALPAAQQATTAARAGAVVTPIRPHLEPAADDSRDDDRDDDRDDANEPGEADDGDAPAAIEHRTDLGNARRFVARFGDDARYVAKWQQWLLWDGSRYLRDETEQVMRWAKATVRLIGRECELTEDPDEREQIGKWAMRSEAEARLRAMLSLTQSEPEISIAAEQLDADNWRLNCRNGLVDLRAGALASHTQAALCTKRAEADYQPHAKCPTWLAFLRTIFAGDEELIAYLQRAVGYSLTGDTSEQCLFVLHGTGANGKSTFIETITSILADYGATTPTETLMVKHGDSIPSDVARLVGARFVAASESGDGRRLDEELVKRITGGDRMTARFMHRDWFQFTPVLKLWLAVNHEPQIRGTDHGIWRRIHLVPFAVTIPDEQQDKSLKTKLLAERAGILAWAIEGCLAWQRGGGLRPPEKVVAATKAYRARMDNIGQFLGEMTTKTPTAATSAKRLYGAYEAWCQESSETLANQTRFGRYLNDHGFIKRRTMRGIEWIGLGLLAPTEEMAPEPDGLFA